jgi:hypothetical protein
LCKSFQSDLVLLGDLWWRHNVKEGFLCKNLRGEHDGLALNALGKLHDFFRREYRRLLTTILLADLFVDLLDHLVDFLR